MYAPADAVARSVSAGLVVLAAGALGCSQGPCGDAVPPPDRSNSIGVAPALACAIAEQKELAGGLTWTASGSPAGAPSTAGGDGGSPPSFSISQSGYAANTECTAACGYDYNECFLPDGYLEAYVTAESTRSPAGAGTEAGAGYAIGTGGDGGSACPDSTSVEVTCTYTSAGFCE